MKMNRYVNVDAVKEALKQNTPQYMWGEVLTTVNVQPYIDIVQCKECKYERDGEEFMWCEHPRGLDSIVKPDDYCSYGEREGE